MDALTLSARVRGRDQRTVLQGCRDMLSEAAEQFRLNDNLGHADLCEIYKTEAENVLKGLKPYPEH